MLLEVFKGRYYQSHKKKDSVKMYSSNLETIILSKTGSNREDNIIHINLLFYLALAINNVLSYYYGCKAVQIVILQRIGIR